MQKLQQIKMDEEIQKITPIYSSKRRDENEYYSNSYYSCSFKLFLVRLMLFAMFFCFCFFVYKLIQKKNILEINVNQSHRLLNKENIYHINNLKISLNIEHSKYVHLKIEDKDNKRWEIPKEILNHEYFDSLSNKENNNDNYDKDENKILFKMDIHGLNDFATNKNFNFDLYFESPEDNQKKIFYSFKTDKNFLFSDNLISFQSYLTTDDIYGFGERIHNFKLEEGVYTIWPIDRRNLVDDGKGSKNLYGHQPIGLHKTKYKNIWLGFVFLNSNAQDVQIHRNTLEQKTILSHKTIGGIIDYYIIVDNSPENVIKDIHYLIGKPILPPYWALGVHQCRWGFKNTFDFENVYNNYIERKIPIDSMWIDIDAMENYKIFTLNKQHFKNLPKVVDNIHKNQAKFIPIIDIAFSSYDNDMTIYNKIGDENNLFIKSGYTNKNLFGKVWPKKAVFPDFFNPNIKKIWDYGLDNYLKIIDYDGIWLDMNEPALTGGAAGEIFENEDDREKYRKEIEKNTQLSYIPGYIDNTNVLIAGSLSLNAITYNNERLYNNKPLLSVYQCKQTYNYLKRKLPHKRPFILTRANSLGTGNYAFHWLGDNFSKNDYIKYSISGIFNYNIFGIPLTGADICGFNNNADGKLCARWYNVGAFYPFSRNHNSRSAKDQYPWTFGQNIENIIKKDIMVRYSLIRYFYSQLFLVSLNEKGAFFKPVMFEYPLDKNSYDDIESKIMLGEALLLCAFFENHEKNKTFIFPNSNFNMYPSGYTVLNYTNDSNYSNKLRKSLSGKLNELHLFMRGGYIIPMQDTFDNYVMNTYYLRQQKINLIINPDHEGYSKGTIFFDNDEIDTIELEKYIRINLEFKNKILSVEVINKKKMDYIFKDNIINRIEIWRVSEIMEFNSKKDNEIVLKYDLISKKEKQIKGKIDLINNKLIIDFNENNIDINLFTLEKVYLN